MDGEIEKRPAKSRTGLAKTGNWLVKMRNWWQNREMGCEKEKWL